MALTVDQLKTITDIRTYAKGGMASAKIVCPTVYPHYETVDASAAVKGTKATASDVEMLRVQLKTANIKCDAIRSPTGLRPRSGTGSGGETKPPTDLPPGPLAVIGGKANIAMIAGAVGLVLVGLLLMRRR